MPFALPAVVLTETSQPPGADATAKLLERENFSLHALTAAPTRRAVSRSAVWRSIPRPQPHATVSAPVTPAELRPSLSPEQFTLKNMPERLKKTGDLWAGFLQSRQRLEPALARLKTTPR